MPCRDRVRSKAEARLATGSAAAARQANVPAAPLQRLLLVVVVVIFY